jgi:hypothetical protein
MYVFWTLPLLLGPREDRPAIIHAGITVLNFGSRKNPSPAPGASAEELQREQIEQERRMSILPDLYLQPSVQGFQYPGVSPDTSRVRYIGQPPLPPTQHSLPDWWQELDQNKRLVLATQGTVANQDCDY